MAWIEDILAEGNKQADEVEVYYTEGTAVTAELKRRVLEVASRSQIQGLGIRTIQAGRIGASSTNNPERWRECLEAALASGKLATPHTWGGLPNQAAITRTAPTFDASVTPDATTAKALVSRLLEGAGRYPVDITGGSADLSIERTTIANSHGLRYSGIWSHVSVAIEAIREQSTGSEFQSSAFMDIDPGWVGERAAFLAANSVGGVDVATGDYDVILSPIAAAQLIGAVIAPALSGRTVHAGRSRLAGRLGEQCFDTRLQLYDDPFAHGLGSTAWDAEGVPTARLDFVRDGVLTNFAYDLKTAYRYGKQTTASAVRSGYGGAPSIGIHNLVVDGIRSRINEDLAIYVHDVVGAHTANASSGDFSVECSNPYWMENGEYGEPIRKAMIAGNVFELFASIAGIGPDTRVVGGMILPSIRFNKLHIIGT